MNLAVNKLIVAFYAGLALVVFVIVYYGYRLQVTSRSLLEEQQTKARAAASASNDASRAGRQVSLDRRRLSEQRRTIAELRRLLEKRTADLQAQNTQLQRQSEDYRRLKEQADRYLATIYDLMQDGTAAAEPADGPSRSTNDPQVGGDTNDLASALEQAQLEVLRSRAEIADLEMAALGEHAKLAEATRTVVAAGQAAVPALSASLTDENPALRAWAAETLGLMGPDAMASVDALFMAAEDDDANVRQAARRALERIEESF